MAFSATDVERPAEQAERDTHDDHQSESDHDPCGHAHFSHRAPWLRAMVLGANDGLVSVAALMMGVGGADADLRVMQLAGVAGLVGGALSMACGEYISVSSQKDAEEADIEKERAEQAKGERAQQTELEELTAIYRSRGLSAPLARQVAVELTEKDVIRAHARDELGIDIDDLANPLQASLAGAVSFVFGAAIPLLAGAFVRSNVLRLVAVLLATTAGLLLFGGTGAALGGARVWRGSLRVLIGGWLAMGLTYGIGAAFSAAVGAPVSAA
ncbi:Fe(2+)/(Mn2+) transporter pcl1 [Monoraphidium neglectum]|uniref:Fe(2+)/(Mn2+) transporter pcl1 n=1 Tax=Monoraphidium neglectum TaxID=145388 RepID=A0A0D2L8M6_9CHLO|nr:Fe(2+)/(Mn2+) transporter pcl1 [Monoraphidium neglectum]KIZ03149.1 Fe(2+)/(Mn2+) transporter pcl1 [Monoraphidium neglectum]|eukprot:XP_013902168.1 Fe(2+)/(Mn2+) transporter pcl1 [Monoraphidium neglectum]